MRKPASVNGLEKLGRVRLSANFYFRDFLYSEVSQIYGVPNIPDDPDLAIEAGRHLCEELLEPLQESFGRITIRSAYRSCAVNQVCNEKRHGCAKNESNYAGHIWDRRDNQDKMGATACIVIPRFDDYVQAGGDWQSMAWWIHDHLPYSDLYFFPRLTAFNITWHQCPERSIGSYIAPAGILTRPGMANNHEGGHEAYYSAVSLFDMTQFADPSEPRR